MTVTSVLNAVATLPRPTAVDFEAVGASTWDGVSSEDDFHVRAVVAGGQDCSLVNGASQSTVMLSIGNSDCSHIGASLSMMVIT